MLAELAGKRVLLLQGPAGPCFRRLARKLEASGAQITKVNFNAADNLFFSRGDVVRYRGDLEGWPATFRRLVEARGIEAVVLFGDLRARHRVAIEEGPELGLLVYVLEEGYLRPDFVTLERGGVGSRSSMPRDPEFFRRVEPRKLPEPKPVGDVLTPATLYAVIYACTHGMFSWRYPHYEHHRNIRPFHQAFYWSRGGIRRVLHGRRDRRLDGRIAAGELSPFFLLPLQVHLDAAMHDCDYASVDDFVREVVASFAEHAPKEARLVLKDHPLGRPYRDYSPLVAELRRAHRLGERLLYVDVIHLPTALLAAEGTVLINSTVGLSSIHHGTPVKCLGHAIYDMPGLTAQVPLDAFWREPGEVDDALYQRFRYWLRTNNQLNGSVWTEIWD